MAGENALWLPAGGGGERFVNADNADPVPDKLRVSEVPLQDWARASERSWKSEPGVSICRVAQ